MYSTDISPVCIPLNVSVPDTLVGVDDLDICSTPDTIYAITSDTDMLNAPYSLFARYSLCTRHYAALCGAQSLWIICSMVNSRCRHATVCISSSAAIHIFFPILFQKCHHFKYFLKIIKYILFRQNLQKQLCHKTL